jgi:hypothetical protein
MEDLENAHRIFNGKPERMRILECIVEKQCGKMWIGFIWHRIWTSIGIF